MLCVTSNSMILRSWMRIPLNPLLLLLCLPFLLPAHWPNCHCRAPLASDLLFRPFPFLVLPGHRSIKLLDPERFARNPDPLLDHHFRKLVFLLLDLLFFDLLKNRLSSTHPLVQLLCTNIGTVPPPLPPLSLPLLLTLLLLPLLLGLPHLPLPPPLVGWCLYVISVANQTDTETSTVR